MVNERNKNSFSSIFQRKIEGLRECEIGGEKKRSLKKVKNVKKVKKRWTEEALDKGSGKMK
jgi:hypothetical protein